MQKRKVVNNEQHVYGFKFSRNNLSSLKVGVIAKTEDKMSSAAPKHDPMIHKQCKVFDSKCIMNENASFDVTAITKFATAIAADHFNTRKCCYM